MALEKAEESICDMLYQIFNGKNIKNMMRHTALFFAVSFAVSSAEAITITLDDYQTAPTGTTWGGHANTLTALGSKTRIEAVSGSQATFRTLLNASHAPGIGPSGNRGAWMGAFSGVQYEGLRTRTALDSLTGSNYYLTFHIDANDRFFGTRRFDLSFLTGPDGGRNLLGTTNIRVTRETNQDYSVALTLAQFNYIKQALRAGGEQKLIITWSSGTPGTAEDALFANLRLSDTRLGTEIALTTGTTTAGVSEPSGLMMLFPGIVFVITRRYRNRKVLCSSSP